MDVGIIGLGYVGIATAVTLGELGHRVFGVDTNQEKIRLLSKGVLPIHEPGVDALLLKLQASGRLSFTTRLSEVMDVAEILFIAVGTPSLPDGRANLDYVKEVYEDIGRLMKNYKVIVNKSTVPVGTADWAGALLSSELAKRGVKIPFDIVSNPEFLQEGKALENARRPDRIVIGCKSDTAKAKMLELYKRISAPIILTNPRNAEMIKYASNAFLALKISFMNELARICEPLAADVVEVAKGMGLDKRIGPSFLRAGIGYGGSCFPKDVAALYQLGQENQQEMLLLRDTMKVNEEQINWFLQQMETTMNSLAGKKVAMFGLSFKPDTDDLREAPSWKLTALLLQKGVSVVAYDPVVKKQIHAYVPNLMLAKTPYEAVGQADAIVLCTEWEEFRELDWAKIKKSMAGNYVFDGRNALPVELLISLGFQYLGVGRKK